MRDRASRKYRGPVIKEQGWLWLAAAALLPAAVFLFLYRQNMNYYEAGLWLAVVSAILVAVSAGSWLVFHVLFRSPLSATLSTMICWVFFYSSHFIMEKILDPLGMVSARLLLILCAAIVVALCVGFLCRKLSSNVLGGIFALTAVGLVLLMNTCSILFFGQKDSQAISDDDIKSVFTVDVAAARPNVYWFHCDGMLGFSAMETYFGDAQQEFSAELESRGFSIHRDASFESGHYTQIALPCLMSPYAYDRWISDKVATLEDAYRAREHYSSFFKLRLRNELLEAFLQGGYTTAVQPYSSFIFPVAERVYYPADGGVRRVTQNVFEDGFLEMRAQMVKKVNRSEFLEKCSVFFETAVNILGEDAASMIEAIDGQPVSEQVTAPLSHNDLLQLGLSEHGAERISWTAYTVSDLLQSAEEPNFCIFWCDYAHFPFVLDEDGNLIANEDSRNIGDYPAQHRFTAKVLLNLVDMILAEDPDAVIVLQSDHGLHGNSEEAFEEYFGKEGIELDLWNQVMSAIRVPEEYKNGEEEYALKSPLNISRYLVNNFVGENYEYLE